MNFNRIFVFALFFLGFAVDPQESYAWVQSRCVLGTNGNGQLLRWSTNEYKVFVDPKTIPSGSGRLLDMQSAIANMNKNPSNLRYTLGGSVTDNILGMGSHRNEIYFYDFTLGGIFPDDAKIIAQEVDNANDLTNCRPTESDIQVNTNYRLARPPVGSNKIELSNSKNPLFEYGGSNENLISTIMHEIGHGAGLDHEGDVMNLMGGDNLVVANGNVVAPYIGEDTAGGLISLFGQSPAVRQDVSLSHWRWGGKKSDGGGGFYSTHFRTRMFNTANMELAKVCPYVKPNPNGSLIAACPEPVYRVNKGQTVNLELSYENSGSTPSLAVKVNYYLSADNIINTADTLLNSATLTFLRNNAPSTFNHAVIIPNTVAIVKGRNYWLGAIVDPTNIIAEQFEGNNATYVGIRVN
jgi:CARDB